MTSYDDKIIFYDPEWEEAQKADESPVYYWRYMDGGGRCIKLYKPSIARLLSKRA